MTISKYTKNLYSSEVYRELERQEVRKGGFELTDEQRIKQASLQVVRSPDKIDAAPSDDLTMDIARLASAFRAKGFEKQASDLEESLAIYKVAENSLYNVTVETNKDFFEFAHRDGDFQVVPGDYGAVETIESAAEKIRTMIGKVPTGNLPKGASIAEIASIIRQADDSGDIVNKLKFDKDYTVKSIDSLIAALGEFQKLSFDNFQLNTPAADSLYRTLGADPSKYYAFIKLHNAAFGNEAANEQTVVNKIMANPAQAGAYLSSIGSNYKLAGLDIELISNGNNGYGYTQQIPEGQTTQNQKATELAETKQKAQVVAQQILRDHENLKYNAEREKSNAQGALSAWGKGVSELIANLNSYKESAAGLKSPKDYLTFADSLVKFIPTIEYKVKAPAHAFVGFGVNSNLNTIVPQIKRNASNLLERAKSAIKITDDATKAVNNTGGRLASVEKAIDQALKDGLIDENHGLIKVKQNAATMRKILSDNAAGGQAYVVQKLGEQFDQYKDYKDFDIKTQQLANQVNGLIAKLKEQKRGK